jgi:hypothetical protein
MVPDRLTGAELTDIRISASAGAQYSCAHGDCFQIILVGFPQILVALLKFSS